MKHLAILFSGISFLVISLSMASCSHDGRTAGSDVSDFEVHQVLKSASKSFLIQFEEGDSVYITLSASVLWPVNLGNRDIVALQDTLIGSLGVDAPYSIDEAMSAFVTNPAILFDDDARTTEVDSVPAISFGMPVNEISVNARVIDLNEQYVTYQVNNFAYTGGAHPNFSVSSFTYDFKEAKILSFTELFLPESEQTILSAIIESLCGQLGVSGIDGLAQAGIFTDQLHVSHDVYIADGQIVFQYNPYDISPYSMGEINVNIPAFELQGVLTPVATALLLEP